MRALQLSLAALSLLVVAQAFHCNAASTAGAQEKTYSILIVTGHDVRSHRWRETTPFTRRVLEETGRFTVKVSEDAAIFETSALSRYDGIILNYGFWRHPELSRKARDGLLKFVSGGGGLVSLHFACSSYQDWPEYRELLGRVWVKGRGGHGPRGKFTVKIQGDHPITRGMQDFEADDELYAKLSGDAAIEVLASAYSDWSKKVEPIVWVKRYGKGRVYHNVLGHDMRARRNQNYIRLLRRGVEWAVSGKVTLD